MLIQELSQNTVAGPEIEQLARKHGVSTREIETQLEQGIAVEREHTSDDAVARRIALDHLNERPDYYSMLKRAESQPAPGALLGAFLKFIMSKLNLKQLPQIDFQRHLDSEITTHQTFGYYDPDTDAIRIAVGQRHIMDIFRTLAHELVHHRQRQLGQVHQGSGDTGSDQENQANALAGVLMREFADLEPQAFGVSDAA